MCFAMALRHDDSTVNIVIGIIIIFLTPVLNCQGMKKIMLLLLFFFKPTSTKPQAEKLG